MEFVPLAQVEQLQERLRERVAEAVAGQEAQRRLQASYQAASADRDRLQDANVSPASTMLCYFCKTALDPFRTDWYSGNTEPTAHGHMAYEQSSWSSMLQHLPCDIDSHTCAAQPH